MKKLIWMLLGAGLVGAAALMVANRELNSPSEKSAAQAAAAPAPGVKPPPQGAAASVHPPASVGQVAVDSEPAGEASATEAASVLPTAQPVEARSVAKAKTPFSSAVARELQTLLEPKADFADKQAAWKQLRETGKLSQAITELEHRSVEDPSDSECLAVLGQAYLQKAGTLQDMREQGILGMKADMTFEAALKVDPQNWEARFVKAVAMSYWPPELNKSQEIMENLSTLIDQQEAQSPQPYFAQTYALLGDQYKKAGYPDLARQMWQHGANLYPNDTTLRQKLTAQQP